MFWVNQQESQAQETKIRSYFSSKMHNAHLLTCWFCFVINIWSHLINRLPELGPCGKYSSLLHYNTNSRYNLDMHTQDKQFYPPIGNLCQLYTILRDMALKQTLDMSRNTLIRFLAEQIKRLIPLSYLSSKWLHLADGQLSTEPENRGYKKPGSPDKHL